MEGLAAVFKRSMVAFIFLVTVSTAAGAVELESQLVIVTSFPEAMFSRFRDVFQDRHPGVKVKVLNKKTSAAISYIQQQPKRPADILWASSPDAFEVLKDMERLASYRPAIEGIPGTVGGHPVNDPDGFYSGFALSGYGIMWNTEYLGKHALKAPEDWKDLARAEYFRHVGISAPSRSGTTHVAVETVLQREGWINGWATWLEIAGNLATVTARSYGVPDGVNTGRFGIGVVIDFFGLSAKASGFPSEFAYPPRAAMIPANIAIIEGTKHPKAAAAFIEFLLSSDGQALLFEPAIRRLPIRPDSYAGAPAGYPNPYADERDVRKTIFDSAISRKRYHLVNALFDQMITFRIKALNRAWKAIHKVETLLAGKPNSEANRVIAQARRLASAIPLTEEQATDPAIASVFIQVKRGIPMPRLQADLQREWEDFSRRNLSDASRLAEMALSILSQPETQ
jgi:ABC-type Fe3+ transport system substrate-binding protein